MTKKDVGAIVRTAVSLFLICAVCAGIVAFVNSVTNETIAANAAREADAAKSAVLPAADSFETVTLADGSAGNVGKNAAGETVGYVFTTAASGYGGTIKLITGFDTAGAVTGVQILEIQETPGLGMNAKRESWISQFTGTTGEVSVVKNKQPAENEILAITSATISSRAVTKAVNAARGYFNELTAGEEG